MATQAPPSGRITRGDLERGIRSLQDGLRDKVEKQKNTVLTVATVAGVVAVLIVFLAGRRSGKRKTTIVEIRRV
jgi:hypothetical protein